MLVLKRIVSGLYITSVVSLGIAGLCGNIASNTGDGFNMPAFAAENSGLSDGYAGMFELNERSGIVVNVHTDLSVRKAPHSDAEITDKIKNNTSVIVCSEKGEWYEIAYDGKRGYVSKDYVEVKEEDLSSQKYILNNLNINTGGYNGDGYLQDYISTEELIKRNLLAIQPEEVTSEETVKETSEAEVQTTESESVESAEGDSSQAEVTENTESAPKGRAVQAELTAYCNDAACSGNWGGMTAMETSTRVGVIAAPSEVALGSKIYIPELQSYKEDGIFSVEDRGGAIKVKDDGTYIIDVWMPTHDQVVAFGRKKTTIYLMD